MLAVQHIRAIRYKEAVKKGFSHELLERGGTAIRLIDYIKEYSEQRSKSGLWAEGHQYTTLIYWVNKIAPEEVVSPKKSATTNANIDGDTMAILQQVVSQITGGKGHISSARRL